MVKLGIHTRLRIWPTFVDEGSTPSNGTMKIGDKVSKVTGDYNFEGVVVAVFQKLSGATRYVVENQDGILHIFSEKNLKPMD